MPISDECISIPLLTFHHQCGNTKKIHANDTSRSVAQSSQIYYQTPWSSINLKCNKKTRRQRVTAFRTPWQHVYYIRLRFLFCRTILQRFSGGKNSPSCKAMIFVKFLQCLLAYPIIVLRRNMNLFQPPLFHRLE